VSLAGFESFPFTFEDKTRPVYTRGRGRGVVVMHEVPGITPEVARFATRVADAGFRVYAPSLFGTPGKPESVAYDVASMLHCCVSREFKVLAANASSPITDWLRALCRHAHAECGGPGVGAIGMCMTGNFALALMVDESVLAPVLSQPSLPAPYTRAQREGLHLSPADLEIVKRRAAAGCGVLAMRFTADPLCRAERFERLRRELGDGVETIEIDSRPGNPWNLPKAAHSVVTRELVDAEGHPTRAALDRVLGFFEERLS
jgi:dienelactone hydrolase